MNYKTRITKALENEEAFDKFVQEEFEELSQKLSAKEREKLRKTFNMVRK
jgi:hypothetical protein